MNEADRLGRMVRDVWIRWAKEQPNPKPSWLVEWDDLPEVDREVDRRIGATVAFVEWVACINECGRVRERELQTMKHAAAEQCYCTAMAHKEAAAGASACIVAMTVRADKQGLLEGRTVPVQDVVAAPEKVQDTTPDWGDGSLEGRVTHLIYRAEHASPAEAPDLWAAVCTVERALALKYARGPDADEVNYGVAMRGAISAARKAGLEELADASLSDGKRSEKASAAP